MFVGDRSLTNVAELSNSEVNIPKISSKPEKESQTTVWKIKITISHQILYPFLKEAFHFTPQSPRQQQQVSFVSRSTQSTQKCLLWDVEILHGFINAAQTGLYILYTVIKHDINGVQKYFP